MKCWILSYCRSIGEFRWQEWAGVGMLRFCDGLGCQTARTHHFAWNPRVAKSAAELEPLLNITWRPGHRDGATRYPNAILDLRPLGLCGRAHPRRPSVLRQFHGCAGAVRTLPLLRSPCSAPPHSAACLVRCSASPWVGCPWTVHARPPHACRACLHPSRPL